MHHHCEKDTKNKIILSLALTLILFAWEFFSLPLSQFVLTTIAIVLYFYSGEMFIREGLKELKNKKPGMMALVLLGLTVAFFYSLWALWTNNDHFLWELALLVDVMLIGHYIEMVSFRKARESVKDLISLLPKKARLEDETLINIEFLKPGDIVIVKAGEHVPSDGLIIEGSSSVELSHITGESKPVFKEKGDEVLGGSLVLDGLLKVKIEKDVKHSYLSQIQQLMKQIEHSKSKYEDLADKAASILFYFALFASVVTFLFWYNVSVEKSILKALTVLVIACPHALGLAIPMVVSIATRKLAQKGILIKNKEVFEHAKDSQIIIFDKTGTLTKGNFKVTIKGNHKDIIYSIEKHVNHPIAQAITKQIKGKELPVSDVKVYPGKGVSAIINGTQYFLGNNKLINTDKEGIFLSNGKEILAEIILEDELREEAKEVVSELKKMGKRIIMVTGDNETNAKKIVQSLGIEYRANVLPHEKVEIVREMKKQGKVMFIGDGINDAPALLEAHVGISMNSLDITIESADVVLINNSLRNIPKLINYSKLIYRKMLENVIWASLYNVIAIPLATGIILDVGLTPATGAIFMSLSDVVIVLNALYLNKQLE